MRRVKSRQLVRVATIAVTAIIAVGAGRFMQSDPDPGAEPLRSQAGFLIARAPATGQPPAAASPEPVLAAVESRSEPVAAAPSRLPVPPADPVVPAGPVAVGSPEAAVIVAPAQGEEVPDTPFLYLDGKPACPADLKATAVPGGMVYLAFEAPCQRGKPVTLGHAGLSASVAVPVNGRLAQILPVLDPAAPYTVTLMDGAEVSVDLPEASAASFDHVVLQWSGEAGLHLHALEFGARYGEPGHVWAGAPMDALHAIRGDGGFLTRIGDPALGQVAEVYTFPVGELGRQGSVELSVELSVSEATCGSDVSGEVLSRSVGGGIDAVEITLAVPGCEALGDILVLKNILRDLKIAAN